MRSIRLGGKRVSDPAELEDAMKWMLDYDGPALLDMRIDRDENVFPYGAPGAPLDDIIGAVNVVLSPICLRDSRTCRLRTLPRQMRLRIAPTMKEADNEHSAEAYPFGIG